MKTKYIAIIALAVVAGALAGVYFYHNNVSSSATPDDHGAYLAKSHISENDAISALNANDIASTDYDFGDLRIYLKDKKQWFIMDGAIQKFHQICGIRCGSTIPIAIP